MPLRSRDSWIAAVPDLTVPVAPPGDEVGSGPGELVCVPTDAETVGVVTSRLWLHAAVSSASVSGSASRDFVRTIVDTLSSSSWVRSVRVG